MNELKITLTEKEVEYVLNSLGKEPYNQSAQLIGKIFNQADEQMKGATKEQEEIIEEEIGN
jgi:hydrogenase maturation factor